MGKAENNSIKLNMFLNSIRGILGVIFPLITFPYVSRILGAENLGKYNFANSVISYFLLVSALGVYSYAVREGARFRDDKEKLNKFADKLFSLNIWSTIVGYLLLVLTIIAVPKMQEYTILLGILSFQIVFKTLSVEWIYTIYEDFLYITLRSIIIQIVSLGLMFIFIHNTTDYYKYAVIVTIASGGSSAFNFIHVRKYIKFKIVTNLNLKVHLKPIMLIFATSLAISIFVSSDTTILGFMCDNITVGVYSVSVKVYTIIKTVLTSVLAVTIPRLAFYLGVNDKTKYKDTLNDLFSTTISLAVPAMIGIFVLSRQVILIVAGSEYMAAESSLSLLCIALIFSMFSWCWGQCVLITLKMEKILFISTLISAVINIVLNLILIPLFQENAAAFTTIVAEFVCMFINWWYGRKYVRVGGVLKTAWKVLVGCISIIVVTLLLQCILWPHFIIYTIVDIILSVIVYFVMEIILKNESIYSVMKQMKNICKRK